MNECIFLLHIAAVLVFVYIFSYLEKAGLFIIFALQIIFANLFILKQTSLFGLTVTTTDCFTIGSFITLNLIREKFGKTASDKAIFAGLCSILFLPIMSFFLLHYNTTEQNIEIHNLYNSLLTPSKKIFLVSLICMVTFQKLDTVIFSSLRKTLSIQAAMFISLCITQMLDTICFTYGALSSIMPNLASIVFFSYLIKILSICIMTPATKTLMKRMS